MHGFFEGKSATMTLQSGSLRTLFAAALLAAGFAQHARADGAPGAYGAPPTVAASAGRDSITA